MERLLKIKDICDLLQVSQALVYKWVHFGYIPYVKIGSLIRFKEFEIIRWLKVKEKRGRNKCRIDIDEFIEV